MEYAASRCGGCKKIFVGNGGQLRFDGMSGTRQGIHIQLPAGCCRSGRTNKAADCRHEWRRLFHDRSGRRRLPRLLAGPAVPFTRPSARSPVHGDGCNPEGTGYSTIIRFELAGSRGDGPVAEPWATGDREQIWDYGPAIAPDPSSASAAINHTLGRLRWRACALMIPLRAAFLSDVADVLATTMEER